MTGDIVNLRNFRKAKARAARQAKAAENRRKFGQTKDEKALTSSDRQRLERDLDGARRDSDAD